MVKLGRDQEIIEKYESGISANTIANEYKWDNIVGEGI
ncbi:hypothetical protein LCGC14_1493940 [marine sediment metagenome]|uniref:Uncharacterized protein n=1 Tax=marine sediment metagenome TaxID=412755 RepID=A0A0F9M7I1_9ZZZZ